MTESNWNADLIMAEAALKDAEDAVLNAGRLLTGGKEQPPDTSRIAVLTYGLFGILNLLNDAQEDIRILRYGTDFDVEGEADNETDGDNEGN